MEKVAKKIETIEIRSDDIWIVTYPKCGTTLTQVTTIELQTRTQDKLFWGLKNNTF